MRLNQQTAIPYEYLLINMKICITTLQNKSIILVIPLGSSLGLFIVKKFIFNKLRKSGVKLIHKQKKQISKAFKNASKILKGYKLLEITDKNSENIVIYL